MTFKEFAEVRRLKISRDPADNTDVIRGRRGKSHLYEYGDGLVGVAVMPETNASHSWTAARKAFRSVGMTITQNGDCEGAAIFDPTNHEQVRVAMRYAEIRRRRKSSPAQAAVLAKGREMARAKISVVPPVAEAVLAPRNDDEASGGIWVIRDYHELIATN